MAGDSGMAGKVALLLWAQTLGLAGAQTPQLLVEPPWTPAVLWDRVTLTCQGSGTASDTTWYKNWRRWWQEGHDRVTVTESGTYQCQRPRTGHSPPVTVSYDRLVLQVPARALLEGDTVTLRCRVRWDSLITSVSFYRNGKELGTLQDGTELSLSPLQRNHSGHYHCRGKVYYLERPWMKSEPVAVTVQVPVANATITPGPPALQVTSLLEVTPQGTTGHLWITVAAALGGSLLFLLLLVAGVVGWHRWNNMAARKQQESVPPCHHTPGSPGDLRRAGSNPWATAGMQGHLRECAVTLGTLGAHGKLGTLGDPTHGHPHL